LWTGKWSFTRVYRQLRPGDPYEIVHDDLDVLRVRMFSCSICIGRKDDLNLLDSVGLVFDSGLGVVELPALLCC
jgi:hypothetical protein